MRKFALVILLGASAASSGFAQGSNTGAGLAGVAAGAALGAAANQGSSTTPSSVPGSGGGSGSSAMEIQIMAFDGMRRIARDIAQITARHASACRAALATDSSMATFDNDKNTLVVQRKALEKAEEQLRQQEAIPGVDVSKLRAVVTGLEAQFVKASDQIDSDLFGLKDTTKQKCAILVEDTASANQVALYQAVHGYYLQLGTIHSDLEEFFSLQVVPSLSISLKSDDGPTTRSVRVTNVGSRPRQIRDLEIVGSDKFAVEHHTCEITLQPTDSCDIALTFWATQGVPDAKTYSAMLQITSGESGSHATDSVQTVQLTGEVTESSTTITKKKADAKNRLDKLISPKNREESEKALKDLLAQPAAATPPPATPSGAGGGSATPVDLNVPKWNNDSLGGLEIRDYLHSVFLSTNYTSL